MKNIKTYIIESMMIEPGSGCWNWEKYINSGGYGRVKHQGRMIQAHHLSYIGFTGGIPTGMMVLHRCDNRKCVNPNHLFIGSHKDNMKDMVLKNRSNKPHGCRNPQSKLSESAVVEIRNSNLNGVELARKFNVSKSAICLIRKNRTWINNNNFSGNDAVEQRKDK